MLQVGLKLGKFLGWRDVTRQESVHILTAKGAREDDSFALRRATVNSVKRETSIFEIIKNGKRRYTSSRALSRELVKNRLCEVYYRSQFFPLRIDPVYFDIFNE